MSGPSDSERIAISEIVARGIRRRRAAEARFKTYGAIAILIAIAFLLTLFATIFSNGISAFTQTHIRLELALDPALIDPDGTRDPEKLKSGNYRKIIETALFSRLAHEHHRALPTLSVRRQKVSRAEQVRHVHVVAAGVHHADIAPRFVRVRHLRGVRQIGLLSHR